MAWEVEHTDEFEEWWEELTEAEQVDILRAYHFLKKGALASHIHIALELMTQNIVICEN